MSQFKISPLIYKDFLRIARLARKGILSQAQWSEFRLQVSDLEEYLLRWPWIRQISWPIITTEYIDSLAALIPKDCCVVEVCAGPLQRRIIAKAMRYRGYSWKATDILTGEDAFKIDYTQYDLVFASWIPYKLDLDLHIAKTNTPFILLGEKYGCTGSEEFWNMYEDQVHDHKPGFIDVPQFSWIHDSTWFLNV